MSDPIFCKIHGAKLECLGGRNAHISNWYCQQCYEAKMIGQDLKLSPEQAGELKRIQDLMAAYDKGVADGRKLENEDCAKVCDEVPVPEFVDDLEHELSVMACTKAIRQRQEKG